MITTRLFHDPTHTFYIYFLDAKTEEEKSCLKLFKADFNIQENAARHHTSDYDLTRGHFMDGKMHDAKPVFRRGEPFDITLNFDRTFDKNRDDIKLVFEVGE